ncbi:hypothetical protein DIURU_005705 [Diutina rugosa]|uniref:Uncharacterized protein n=1 Tax=Diutina rugosa TaxID=5481 RepID=A0A642UCF8_DIURU|nr:uncharacterized protein DIURU_005705 [Diutina rugosa]KAA8896693.1 hypothetical protein DIURU_005705 [Diutina rugosa]
MLRGRAICRTLSCRRYTQIPTAATPDFVSHYYPQLSKLLDIVQLYKQHGHFDNVSPREMQSLAQEFATMDHAGYVWQKVNHEVQNSPQFLRQLTQWFELHRLGLARYNHELSSVTEQATSTQQVYDQIESALQQENATTWHQKLALGRYRALQLLLTNVPELPVSFLKQIVLSNLSVPMSKAETQKVSRLAFVVDSHNIPLTSPIYKIAEKLEAHDSPSSRAGLEVVNELVCNGVLAPSASLDDYLVKYLDTSFGSEIEHLAAIKVHVLHRPFADFTPKELILAIQQSIQREPWHERAYDIIRVLRKLISLAETMPQGQWLHDLDVLIQGGPSFNMNHRISMSWKAGDSDTVIRHPRKFNENPADKVLGSTSNRRGKKLEHTRRRGGGMSGGRNDPEPDKQLENNAKESKSEYVQIPGKLYIHNEIFPLQILQEYLSKDFSKCTPREILDATKQLAQAGDNECDEADANRLYSKLYRLFALNGGDTQCLDAVLQSHNHFRRVERAIRERSKIKAVEGQTSHIIGELDLPQFSDELKKLREALGDKPFSSHTQDLIVNTLQDEIYLGKHSKLILDGTVFNYVRLLKRLERLFALNGGHTAVLDEICRKGKTISTSTQEYRQIPDDFAIHEFVNELSELAVDAGVAKLGSLSALEVLDVCKHCADKNSDYIKLHSNLRNLFRHNGNNTAVLDAVINSQHHFDAIEASTHGLKVSSEYKQLPDDMRLDEFSTELEELLEQLDADKFVEVSSSDILDVTANLSSGSGIFSKLHSNLAKLFAYNGGNTEILDIVLTNVRAFKDLESKRAPEAFAHTSELLNNHAEAVSLLLKEYKAEHSQSTTISPTLFSQLVARHLKSQPNSEPLRLVNQLNLVVDYYPNFLQQLLEIRGNKPSPQWSAHEVEEVYKAFMSVLEYDQDICDEISYIYHKNVTAKQEAMTSANSEDWRNDYNDSERLVSLLSQQKSPVDFDLLNKELGQDELFIKDAVSIALNQDTGKSRASARENKDAPSVIPNPSTLHQYLESAHHQHQASEQSRVREQKAYEWATANNRNHEIPVEFEFRATEPKHTSPLYPARLDPEYEYKVVTADGHSIPSDAVSIGHVVRQPVAQAIGGLPAGDIDRFMDQVHHHERQGWKVMGSQEVEGRPVLILARIPGAGARSSWGSAIKNLLAIAGGGFLVIVGVNYFVEDEKVLKKNTPVEVVSESSNSPSPSPSQLPSADNAQAPKQSILSSLLWANPPKDD